MLTREEVIWAYRILLCREPESLDLIEHYRADFSSVDALRATIMKSEEFLVADSEARASVLSAEAKARQDFVKNVHGSVRKVLNESLRVRDSAESLSRLVATVRAIKSLDFVLVLGDSAAARSLVADLGTAARPPHVILHLVSDRADSDARYCIPAYWEDGLDSAVYIQAQVDFADFLEIFRCIPMRLDFVYVAESRFLKTALEIFYWEIPETGLFLVEAIGDRPSLDRAALEAFVQPLARDIVDHGDFLLVPKSYWYSQLPEIGLSATEPRRLTKSKRTLALAAILKNEAHRVVTMLDSVKGVVDFVSIVDTGSSDETVRLISNWLQANNIDHALQEEVFRDFSHARNLALSGVPSWIDWILMLDGDEFLEQYDRNALTPLIESDEEGWALPRYNYTDEARTVRPLVYPDRQRRLFRNRPDGPHLFVGAVHELLQGIDSWAVVPANHSGVGGSLGGAHIHHMGLVSTQEKWLEKHLFYQSLAGK